MKKDILFYSEGAEIRGHYYLPDGYNDGAGLPCIILCHGFAGVKELLLPAFARGFAAGGFAVIAFDYRGFGESGGERGRLVWQEQVRDIRNAITFAETLPEIDPGRIGLWGTSYGGANAITAASEDRRVKCLAVQLAFGNGERVITGGQPDENKAKLKAMLSRSWQREVSKNKPMMLTADQILTDPQSKEFYASAVKEFPALDMKINFLTIGHTIEYRPEEALNKVFIPLLIVSAENDRVNPAGESEILFEKAREPKAFVEVKGAGHYELYKGDYFKEAFENELGWYKKYLAN